MISAESVSLCAGCGGFGCGPRCCVTVTTGRLAALALSRAVSVEVQPEAARATQSVAAAVSAARAFVRDMCVVCFVEIML
jgi:hypothetical protein